MIEFTEDQLSMIASAIASGKQPLCCEAQDNAERRQTICETSEQLEALCVFAYESIGCVDVRMQNPETIEMYLRNFMRWEVTVRP